VFIDPDECIDCHACVPECPWEAIFSEDNVPEPLKPDVALNALVRERRSEFQVPQLVKTPPPTVEAVDANRERWGLNPRKSLTI
jgi:ferredoxin